MDHYEFGNGEWTYSYNSCMHIHGQYIKMNGSCGYVNYEMIDSSLIAVRMILTYKGDCYETP